jgi:hypothetical protein
MVNARQASAPDRGEVEDVGEGEAFMGWELETRAGKAEDARIENNSCV